MTVIKMMIAYYPTTFFLLLFCEYFTQTSSSRFGSASIHEARAQVHERVGGGKRGLRNQCFDESGFIASCSEELSDDPDDDGIVSQDEFAAFLVSLQCSLSSNMNSDFEACADALSFYALPLILQFLFVQAVCSQQLDIQYTTDKKDCLNSVTKKQISGEAFGFVQMGIDDLQSKRDIERFCGSIYSDVVSGGYIKECRESEIMHGLASSRPSSVGTTFPSARPPVKIHTWKPSSSRTINPPSLPSDSVINEELAPSSRPSVGTTFPSARPSVKIDSWKPSSIRTTNLTSLPSHPVINEELAPSTTPRKSPSPNPIGINSSSSPSDTGKTSNKPSSSQPRSNGRMSASPSIESTFNAPYREGFSSDSWPTGSPRSSIFQKGSSYPSFPPSNNGTRFTQSQNSIVNYTLVRSAAPSGKPPPIPTPNLPSTRAATQYTLTDTSYTPSHATPRNYSSAPSFFHKFSETVEAVKPTSRASPHPSASGSLPPSRSTSSIPTVSSNYDQAADGKTSIEPSCLTKSSFTSFCSIELASDADEDNVISQMDFAILLHKLSCSFEEQPCSGVTPFYALPLALQLIFVQSVCSQQHEDHNNTINTDCSENVIRKDSSGDKIGFVVATDDTSNKADVVEAICRSIYIDVMKEGYFKGCFIGDVSPEKVASGPPTSEPTVSPSTTPSHDHSGLQSRRPSPSPSSEPLFFGHTAIPATGRPEAGTANNRTDCLTSMKFTDLCFNDLLSDSDSDNIASRAEFAMFLDTLPCSIATKNTNETCSRASVPEPKFYALPLTLQYHFVKSVCAQLQFERGSAEGHNCLKDAETGNFDGKPFGFSLVRNGTTNANLPVKEFCGSIYMDVVTSGGYFHECAETELAPTPSLLISLTPSDTVFRSVPSTAPSRNASSQPSKETSNMPTNTSFKHARTPSSEPSGLHSSMPTVHPSDVRNTRPSARNPIQPSSTPTYYSSSRPSSSLTLEPSFSVSLAYSGTNPTLSVTYSPSRPVIYARSTMIPTDASTPRRGSSADKEPSPFPTLYQSSVPTVNQLLGGATVSAAPSGKKSSIPTQNPSPPPQKYWPPDNNFPSEAPSATPSEPTNVAPVVNNDGDARVVKNTILSGGALFAVLISVAALLIIYVFAAFVVDNQRNNKGGNRDSGTFGRFPDMHLSSDSFNAADEMESAHERNDASTPTNREVDSQGGMEDLSPRQTYVTY